MYSVDHERFFPGGPQWVCANLTQAPRASLDVSIESDCQLTQEELDEALSYLEEINEDIIADVIATIPDQWHIEDYERIELARYLTRRRDEMLMVSKPRV